jgi:hypothetical protein
MSPGEARAPAPAANESEPAVLVLEERIGRLEELERNQAELVRNMAEQLEQLTTAVTVLHRQSRILIAGVAVAGVVALAALIVAVRLAVQ